MTARSPFTRMCDELAQALTPQLVARGFTPPSEPFSRHSLKYEFTRQTSTGVQVLEILFNKHRKPLFSVQLYVAPSSGMAALTEHGGTLAIGTASPARRWWPFPVKPFSAEKGVESFLSLLPEVEEWWSHQRSTRHIIVGTLTYPGRKRTP